ncbi:MAG: hypothetical protein ACOX47_13450 [Bacillota bacterium]|jgi:hypothetical protein
MKKAVRIKPANELLLNNKVEDLSAMDFFKTMTDLMILNPTIGNESFEKQFEYIGINRGLNPHYWRKPF